MTGRVVRRGMSLGLIGMATASLLLAGCGGKKTAATNVVGMHDMEVVDGTTNDEMTDLDAVKSNGVGAGNGAANSAVPKPKAPAQKAPADAEAVPDE